MATIGRHANPIEETLRPCRICRRWFRPDPRVGARQRACSNPSCQKARHQQAQARWCARNPDYFIARRIDARSLSNQPPEPLRLRPPLSRLPWDLALARASSPTRSRSEAPETSPEEKILLETLPELASYVRALKERSAGRGTVALRRLLTMVNDYPREPLRQALEEAAQYGLYDLDRVETVILRKLGREYFQIRLDYGDEHDGRNSATAGESAPEKDGHDS